MWEPSRAASGGPANGGTQDEGACSPSAAPSHSLFAFPGYDNFSGRMAPRDWVRAVQAKSRPGHEWRVIWDVAALAPCHPISLRDVPADFICISFYKVHCTVGEVVHAFCVCARVLVGSECRLLALALLASSTPPHPARPATAHPQLFGFPTGVGALLMRKDIAACMRKARCLRCACCAGAGGRRASQCTRCAVQHLTPRPPAFLLP